ncbi:hypothetical protein R84B8_01170 [Treponema sp. R8-4-B8]
MLKRNVFLLGLLVALLAIGLIFVGCDNSSGGGGTGGTGGSGDGGGTGGTGGSGNGGGTGGTGGSGNGGGTGGTGGSGDGGGTGGGGNNNGTNQFIGTWNGTDADGYSVTLVITASTWTLTTYNYSGTYSFSGNTATIKDDSGSTIGTATISSSTLTVTGSGIPYTPYTLTKTTTGGDGGGTSGGTGGGGGSTTVPNAPTGVNATAVSSSSISVSWSAVSGATSYDVYFEIGSSITKNFAGTVTGTSYTHTGLQAGTTYYYYIKAVNSAGSSNYSSSALATTQSSGGGGSGGGGDNQTTYTITFNANGGSVSPTSGTTGTNGSLATLPTPTRSGYTFNGWFTSTSGGTQVTTSTVFSQNSTIYARWTSSAPIETRLDQPIFGTNSVTSSSITINWTLQTTGTTPNGLYSYAAPTNITIAVYIAEDGSTPAFWYDLTSTPLAGTARSYTLSNYTPWIYYVGGKRRVSLRVTCTRSGNTSTQAIMSYWFTDSSGTAGSWVPTY